MPSYYDSNPELSGYFKSLPPDVQARILESGAEISTLGELMQCAEHLLHSDF